MGEIRDKLSGITKSVTTTSGRLIKTAKVNASISSEESKLKKIYIEIGLKVRAMYENGESLGAFFDEKYRKIEESDEKIKALRAKIDLMNGRITCPGCGKVANSDSEFCPKCGRTMNSADDPDDYDDEPEKTDDTPVPYTPAAKPIVKVDKPVAEYKNCPVCGKKNAVTEKFCYSCGRAI